MRGFVDHAYHLLNILLVFQLCFVRTARRFGSDFNPNPVWSSNNCLQALDIIC
jgi:hypothetical protein